MKYHKDDVVSWRVMGAGGPKGTYLGTIRCTVVQDMASEDSDVLLRPLSWAEARELLVPDELDVQQFQQVFEDDYLVESNPEEFTTLVKTTMGAFRDNLNWLEMNSYPYIADVIADGVLAGHGVLAGTAGDLVKLEQEVTSLVEDLKRLQNMRKVIKESFHDSSS